MVISTSISLMFVQIYNLFGKKECNGSYRTIVFGLSCLVRLEPKCLLTFQQFPGAICHHFQLWVTVINDIALIMDFALQKRGDGDGNGS